MEKLSELLQQKRFLGMIGAFAVLMIALLILDSFKVPEQKPAPLRTLVQTNQPRAIVLGNNEKVSNKLDTSMDKYLTLPLRNPFEPPKERPNLQPGNLSSASAPVQTPSHPLLKGILFVKGNYWAILQWQNQTTHYAIGAQLGPYKIQEINKNTVTLKGNGDQLVLKL